MLGTTWMSSACAGRTSCIETSPSRQRGRATPLGRETRRASPRRHDSDRGRLRSAGVQAAVGFNYRNAPAVELAREIVGSGRIGEIETASVRLFSDYAAHPDGALSWRFDRTHAGNGVLGDLASHGLDLARYVVGQQTGEVVDVVADQATFIPQRPEASRARSSHFATAAGE